VDLMVCQYEELYREVLAARTTCHGPNAALVGLS
jgi:hypothetical protein